MTGTQDEALATLEREMEIDTAKASEVLEARAAELEKYHARLLAAARPVILELLVLHAAMLTVESDGCGPEDVLAAVAMTLDDPRLSITLKKRIAIARRSVAVEAARQKRLRDAPVSHDTPTTERPS